MRVATVRGTTVIRAIGSTPLEIITTEATPDERAVALAEQEEFRKNVAWYGAHAGAIRDQHRGRFICIAGQQLFAGDDAVEVVAQARAAHPGRGGFFSRRISTHRGPRIYANQRLLG